MRVDCLQFKDRPIDVLKKSLVVYHVKCQECEADYIGKTERILFYRIQENKGESSYKTDSAFHEHQLATSH